MIDFLAEWVVTLLSPAQIVKTRAPHLTFMFVKEYCLKVNFFCSNALIALARSLCKCLLAVLITASGADAVTGYLVRCAWPRPQSHSLPW